MVGYFIGYGQWCPGERAHLEDGRFVQVRLLGSKVNITVFCECHSLPVYIFEGMVTLRSTWPTSRIVMDPASACWSFLWRTLEGLTMASRSSSSRRKASGRALFPLTGRKLLIGRSCPSSLPGSGLRGEEKRAVICFYCLSHSFFSTSAVCLDGRSMMEPAPKISLADRGFWREFLTWAKKSQGTPTSTTIALQVSKYYSR